HARGPAGPAPRPARGGPAAGAAPPPGPRGGGGPPPPAVAAGPERAAGVTRPARPGFPTVDPALIRGRGPDQVAAAGAGFVGHQRRRPVIVADAGHDLVVRADVVAAAGLDRHLHRF